MYVAPTNLQARGFRELVAAVLDQFRLLALESREPSSNAMILTKLNAAPAKTIEGMIVLADGANWNPGGGAGYYGYHSGAWNKLG